MEESKAILGLTIRYLLQWGIISWLLITYISTGWLKAIIFGVSWTILSIERRLNVGDKYR